MNALLGIQSGGTPLVVSLETADIWKLDELSARGRLHAAMLWRVHLQGLMHSPPMAIVDVGTANAAQVALVKDNDLVHALAAKGPNYPLGVGILPRASRCGDHFLDVKAAHPPAKDVTADAIAIAIANQVLGLGIKGKYLNHMLRGPLRRRIGISTRVTWLRPELVGRVNRV